MRRLGHVKVRLLPHHIFWAETLLYLFFSVVIFMPTVSAADVVRLRNRSLLMHNAEPGQLSEYTLKFQYTSETLTGSIDLLFCTSPIPDDPCTPPTGLSAADAVLSDQQGETGYNLSVKSANHMVLSRVTPSVVSAAGFSQYAFNNMRNPTDTARPFSIRINTYASTNATGPIIDLGSVVGSVGEGVLLETQVAPMLLFCIARQVSQDCSTNDGGYYTDMGELSAEAPITAQSQMAVGTNATAGFAITVNGTSMQAGNNVIDPLTVPTASIPGRNQFGINVVANNQPTVGADPDGDFANAVAAPGYDQPNKYMFKDGDLVATSPNVSLIRRFTVSYVVNIKPDLHAGIYTTTLTYICSGRF